MTPVLCTFLSSVNQYVKQMRYSCYNVLICNTLFIYKKNTKKAALTARVYSNCIGGLYSGLLRVRSRPEVHYQANMIRIMSLPRRWTGQTTSQQPVFYRADDHTRGTILFAVSGASCLEAISSGDNQRISSISAAG